jgi:GNAT superfamily N-acetyltransferase
MTISSQETRPLVVRDPGPADEADWRRLWAAYCAFYKTDVAEAVTAATWGRMLAPASPLFGRVAEWDSLVVGFAVSVLHEGSWTTKPCCYLEDLFVAREYRGKGIARALIEDQLRLCRERGWSRLYWHTRESNREARRLYDRFATADDFVRYRLILE